MARKTKLQRQKNSDYESNSKKLITKRGMRRLLTTELQRKI